MKVIAGAVGEMEKHHRDAELKVPRLLSCIHFLGVSATMLGRFGIAFE